MLVGPRRSACPRSKRVASIRPVGTSCPALWCCMTHPSPSEQAYCPNMTDVLCHPSHPNLWYLRRWSPRSAEVKPVSSKIPELLVTAPFVRWWLTPRSSPSQDSERNQVGHFWMTQTIPARGVRPVVSMAGMKAARSAVPVHGGSRHAPVLPSRATVRSQPVSIPDLGRSDEPSRPLDS